MVTAVAAGRFNPTRVMSVPLFRSIPGPHSDPVGKFVSRGQITSEPCIWDEAQDVALERRLLAAVLLLAMTLPLLMALLPTHVDMATPVLLAAFAGVTSTVLPSHRSIQLIGWLSSAILLLSAVFGHAEVASVGFLVMIPFGLAVLTDLALLSAIGFLAAIVASWVMVGPDTLRTLPAFSGESGADWLGRVGVWAWAGWVTAHSLRPLFGRRYLSQHAQTVSALDDAIDRDLRSLEGIANVLADTSLGGPLQGFGLGRDALALATRIDNRRVLLAWIDGKPLNTLSVGWALMATVKAGERSPRRLLKLARSRLDEMVPPKDIKWIAIWDRSTGNIRSAPSPSPTPMPSCTLTERGPRASGRPKAMTTDQTLQKLVVRPEVFVPPQSENRMAIAGVAAAFAAFLVTWLSLPTLALVGVVGLLIATQWALTRAQGQNDKELAATRSQLEERTDLHDDLRHQIGRLHGGLLPYQLTIGDYQATAHRLRGEVLEGSFADLLLDPNNRGHILAGEVAGRGIACRFLALAAQMATAYHVRVGTIPQDLPPVLTRMIRELGKRISFRARLRLGAVTVSSDGSCIGWGTLRTLVQVRGTNGRTREVPLAMDGLAEVTAESWLDDDTRVYLSPAPTLPGPDDPAPALGTSDASQRLVNVVRKGDWLASEHTSLASLFPLIFNGRDAPAHGTLIELALTPQGDEKQEKTAKRATRRNRAPRLAAI